MVRMVQGGEDLGWHISPQNVTNLATIPCHARA